MRAVVVFESMMGNTHMIADAVATGIRAGRPDAEVLCTSAAHAPRDAGGAALVVVGAPTHMWGMPSARSRTMWHSGRAKTAKQGGPTPHRDPSASGPGVREWLAGLPPAREGQLAAAFDTRLDRRFVGGAAPKIAKRLRRKSYAAASPPQGFAVTAAEGPLKPGELERAGAWGRQLAGQLHQPTRPAAP